MSRFTSRTAKFLGFFKHFVGILGVLQDPEEPAMFGMSKSFVGASKHLPSAEESPWPSQESVETDDRHGDRVELGVDKHTEGTVQEQVVDVDFAS